MIAPFWLVYRSISISTKRLCFAFGSEYPPHVVCHSEAELVLVYICAEGESVPHSDIWNTCSHHAMLSLFWCSWLFCRGGAHASSHCYQTLQLSLRPKHFPPLIWIPFPHQNAVSFGYKHAGCITVPVWFFLCDRKICFHYFLSSPFVFLWAVNKQCKCYTSLTCLSLSYARYKRKRVGGSTGNPSTR